MNNEISNKELIILKEKCIFQISKENKLNKKIKNFISVKALYLIYKILKLINNKRKRIRFE